MRLSHSGKGVRFCQRIREDRARDKVNKELLAKKVKTMNSDQSNGNKCQHVKPNGQGCEANAMTDSDFCFFHDPSKARERAAARRAGGVERSRRAVVLPADTPDRPLRSGREVTELVPYMINKILRGELDPKIGSVVGYLLTVQMKAFDQGETEARLAALEAIVRQRPIEPVEHVVEGLREESLSNRAGKSAEAGAETSPSRFEDVE